MKFLGLIALVPLLVVANPSYILGAVRSIFDPPTYKQQPGYRPVSSIRVPAYAVPQYTRQPMVASYRPVPGYQSTPVVASSYRPIPGYQSTPVAASSYRPIPGYQSTPVVASSYRPIPGYQSRPVVASSYSTVPGYGPYGPAPGAGSYRPIPADSLDLINNFIGGFWRPAAKPEKVKEDEGHDDHHFGYDDKNGPDTWPEHFPACGGKAQSPIDIRLNDLEPKAFPKLTMNNYWAQPEKMVVENNGHSIQISGTYARGKNPSISGGPLKNTYEWKQCHLHWGMDDDSGSEHTVNGNKFPMELHCVHWNTKYGTYENAASKSDGLAVGGYFFDIIEKDNPMLQKFIRYTSKVEGKEAKEVKVSDPLPIGILDLECGDGYVNYQGSLTTPPCSEVVTWIVCRTPLTLSANQMEELRTVVKDKNHEDIHNFRPTQPLNGRQVYLSV